MSYPIVRPRRLRRTPGDAPAGRGDPGAPGRAHPARCSSRKGLTEPRPIASLPGVVQHTPGVAAQGGGRGGPGRRRRHHALRRARAARTRSAPAAPTPTASSTSRSAMSSAEVGDSTVVMGDLCLDEFTSHGHCGVLAADGSVDNDATLERYAEMAVAQAAAGVHMVGPSGMMDGQVGVVRRALDAAGYQTWRSSPTRPSTPRRSSARSARRWSRRWSVTARRTSRTRPTCARRCARSRSTSPRAPTSSW